MSDAEKPVSSCQAAVLIYNKETSKWEPKGSGNGLSRVHLYHHTERGTYRIVGRNQADRDVGLIGGRGAKKD